MSPRSIVPRRLGALALAAILVGGCFDPPVREELRLAFAADGSVALSSAVELASSGEQTNAAVERRLEELRARLLAGDDPWAARFAALSAPAERFAWEKRLGALHAVTRSAYVVEPADLARFFTTTDLQVTYEVDAERRTAELTLVPGSPTQATRKQLKRVHESLEPWSEAVAQYLARLRALYAYLDEHPDRARICFGELFSELLEETDKATLGEPSPVEENLLDALGEAMSEVWAILLIESGDDHSLDELSRLVYDPFPARLSITLPVRPDESEGAFEEEADGSLVIPEHSLWHALLALEGRWITPDPIGPYVRLRGKGGGFSLDSFLAREHLTPSESELPDAKEVRAALEAELQPDRLYRLRWAIDPSVEPRLPWAEAPR